MAVEGGIHQRGLVFVVLHVDLRTAPKQQLDHPLVALLGSEHQRGDAVALLQVDLRATLKQSMSTTRSWP